MTKGYECDYCNEFRIGEVKSSATINGEKVVPPVSDTKEYKHEYHFCSTCSEKIENFIIKGLDNND